MYSFVLQTYGKMHLHLDLQWHRFTRLIPETRGWVVLHDELEKIGKYLLEFRRIWKMQDSLRC